MMKEWPYTAWSQVVSCPCSTKTRDTLGNLEGQGKSRGRRGYMQPNSSPGCIRKYKQMYQEIQPKIYIQYHTCVMTPISFFILGITYKICICKLQLFMA